MRVCQKRFDYTVMAAIAPVHLTAWPCPVSQLLVSDATTGTHGTLRWRLRVRGNTAVEFGVVPADHCARHGTLHKVALHPPRIALSRSCCTRGHGRTLIARVGRTNPRPTCLLMR